MIYKAIDRWNNLDDQDYLMHYKYIKKIKIGGHTRYFYSLADLKAYYNAQKNYRNGVDQQAIGQLRNIKNTGFDDEEIETYGDINRINKTKKVLGDMSKTLKKDKKKNNLESAVDTAKFASKNILGSSSKTDLEKKYRKSKRKDQKKFYKKREKMAEVYATKVNKILWGI